MEEYPWLDCLWPNVNTLLMPLLTLTIMSVDGDSERVYQNQQLINFGDFDVLLSLYYFTEIL
jgi:hypothetical protein